MRSRTILNHELASLNKSSEAEAPRQMSRPVLARLRIACVYSIISAPCSDVIVRCWNTFEATAPCQRARDIETPIVKWIFCLCNLPFNSCNHLPSTHITCQTASCVGLVFRRLMSMENYQKLEKIGEGVCSSSNSYFDHLLIGRYLWGGLQGS